MEKSVRISEKAKQALDEMCDANKRTAKAQLELLIEAAYNSQFGKAIDNAKPAA